MEPRAVVVPFAVPDRGRGLGLGLAALLHGHLQLGGGTVALVQLQSRKPGADDVPNAEPAEAVVTPDAWRALTAERAAPTTVRFVVTGSLEPPGDDSGLLKLLAFAADTGETRALVEAPLDEDAAGSGVLRALTTLAEKLGGVLGLLEGLAGLSWDALASVLAAERSLLTAGGQDGGRRSALVYLGRAVEDAPEAAFPAARLGALALEISAEPTSSLADAAERVVDAALADAPSALPIQEAACVLYARRNRAEDAKRLASELVERAPERPQGYAVLAEVERRTNGTARALAVLAKGLEATQDDPGLAVERAALLEADGRKDEAAAALHRVLTRWPTHGGAFARLAGIAARDRNGAAASELVDHALAHESAPVELVRQALELALHVEPEGLARAARLRALCDRVLAADPRDGWARVLHAASLAQSGERDEARRELEEVARLAPGTPFAAEAERGLFVLDDADRATELEGLLRDAEHAGRERLEAMRARAEKLLPPDASWYPLFVCGSLERRCGRAEAARAYLGRALALAPGAAPARRELAELDVSFPQAAEPSSPPPSAPSSDRSSALRRALGRWLRRG